MHRHTLLLAGVAATSALVAPARLRVPPRATLQSHAAAAHPAMYRVVGESTRFVVSGAVATTLLVRRDAETLTSAAPSGKRYAAPSGKRLRGAEWKTITRRRVENDTRRRVQNDTHGITLRWRVCVWALRSWRRRQRAPRNIHAAAAAA